MPRSPQRFIGTAAISLGSYTGGFSLVVVVVVVVLLSVSMVMVMSVLGVVLGVSCIGALPKMTDCLCFLGSLVTLGVGGTGRATVAGLGLAASGWGVAGGVGEPGVLIGPCGGDIAG